MNDIGQVGKFASLNNNVFYNRELVLYSTSDKTALLSTTARGRIPNEDQPFFDQVLFAVRNNGVQVDYVSDFDATFDPKQRLSDFKAGIVPSGIDFTPAELSAEADFKKAKEAYDASIKSANDKIVAKFKKPVIPFETVSKLNIEKLFGPYKDNANRWLNGEKLRPSNDRWNTAQEQLHRRVRDESPQNANLVRVTGTGTRKRVENLTGHSLPYSKAQEASLFAIAHWTDPSQPATNHMILARLGHDIRVHAKYVNIGCQSIPRAEIERLVKQEKWA